MRGWKIAEVAGIGIYVHWTFLVLPVLVASSALSSGSGFTAAADAVVFVLAIFGCVVLHELGHALAARCFGINTRSIVLLPIGGVANLDRMPERPRDELAVALAGPAVNIAIAGVLGWILASAGIVTFGGSPEGLVYSFLVRLFWANIVLAIFNMLPAFPMDGGRVLRALLAMGMPYVSATSIAAVVGQVMAVLLALAGIAMGQWMMVVVALFVFVAGRSEAQAVRTRAMMRSWSVGDAMQRHFHLIPAGMTLEQAARAVLFTDQNDFPVIEGNRLVGMLSKQQSLQLLAQGRGHLRVDEVMRCNVPAIDQSTPLTDSLDRMQTGNYSSLPVTHGGRLVGIISAAALRDWLAAWASRQPLAQGQT